MLRHRLQIHSSPAIQRIVFSILTLFSVNSVFLGVRSVKPLKSRPLRLCGEALPFYRKAINDKYQFTSGVPKNITNTAAIPKNVPNGSS